MADNTSSVPDGLPPHGFGLRPLQAPSESKRCREGPVQSFGETANPKVIFPFDSSRMYSKDASVVFTKYVRSHARRIGLRVEACARWERAAAAFTGRECLHHAGSADAPR